MTTVQTKRKLWLPAAVAACAMALGAAAVPRAANALTVQQPMPQNVSLNLQSNYQSVRPGSPFHIAATVKNSSGRVIPRATVIYSPESSDAISDSQSGQVRETLYNIPAHGSATVRNNYTAQHPGTASVKIRVMENDYVVTSMSAIAQVVSSETSSCDNNTVVNTAKGSVCGLVKNGIKTWFGIPYAAPPIGNLRWRPPQPHAPWSSTLQATSFGNKCQTGRPGVTSSEDCLYINVWKPTGGNDLPVMVHIHGGGFFGGSGNGDNSLLAKRGNVVVVSMNYRLGIFGFLANAALGPHSGDYGLQDQQAALGWVKENIAAFGGNPDNVTIYGESAGASSVCDQLVSPAAAGLFDKAVITSGEYNTLFGVPEQAPRTPEDLEVQDCKSKLPSQKKANYIGAQFAAAVGCGHGADVATCLRRTPVARVEKVAYSPGDGYQYGGKGTIAPTLNGKTLTESPRKAIKSGDVKHVPVIAGVGRDENLIGWPHSAAQYRQLVYTQYGSVAGQVLARYPLKQFDSPFLAWRMVAADSTVVCPALVTAGLLTRLMPVYEYQVNYGDAPPRAFSGLPKGSHHVSGWYLTPATGQGLDVNQQVLQDQEIASVTTFAHTGDPNNNRTPRWPEFKSYGSNAKVMVLSPGGDSHAVKAAAIRRVHQCRFWNGVRPKR